MTPEEGYKYLKENRNKGLVEEIPLWDFPEDMQEELKGLGDRWKDKKEVKKSESTEKIKGGMSDNKSLKEIAQKHDVDIDEILKQLEIGIKVEMEHTDDPKVAIEIAKDHICEFPTYYTELDKMEQSLKQKAK